jgi:hypothetical protein
MQPQYSLFGNIWHSILIAADIWLPLLLCPTTCFIVLRNVSLLLCFRFSLKSFLENLSWRFAEKILIEFFEVLSGEPKRRIFRGSLSRIRTPGQWLAHPSGQFAG